MTRYAIRTCQSCGVRKPQPEMIQKAIYEETGKSQSTVSKETFVGALLNDTRSKAALNRWAMNTSQRTYMKKKKIWMCSDCEKTYIDPNKVKSKTDVVLNYVANVIILAIIAAAIKIFYFS
jgi:hypothetical protein